MCDSSDFESSCATRGIQSRDFSTDTATKNDQSKSSMNCFPNSDDIPDEFKDENKILME